MPLITDRKQVEELYQEAAAHKWVLPAFNSENLTTSEAVLQAVLDFGRKRGVDDLPVTIAITCRYPERPQSENYAHNRLWDLGLRLFMADLRTLTDTDSPYGRLRVMVHLDHVQWDLDDGLLSWDMDQFSSIMYDASTLPFEENIRLTAQFVDKNSTKILIEGACDEITEYAHDKKHPEMDAGQVRDYYKRTAVDLIVADLGTEHRSAESRLSYKRDLAHEITKQIGPRLCLHGSSSVAPGNLGNLFSDGVRKVNLWTALERESTAVLFRDMLDHAAQMAGPERVGEWIDQGLLGEKADRSKPLSSEYFTTTYRQQVVFQTMKEIVTRYLNIWYI